MKLAGIEPGMHWWRANVLATELTGQRAMISETNGSVQPSKKKVAMNLKKIRTTQTKIGFNFKNKQVSALKKALAITSK